jgi:hypothetical protein
MSSPLLLDIAPASCCCPSIFPMLLPLHLFLLQLLRLPYLYLQQQVLLLMLLPCLLLSSNSSSASLAASTISCCRRCSY